ncbi:MAG: hypothetical protein COA66_07550 [Arcobacter sp.]|nr:MAG: hypothetical protein COA66_07550 [Arcobacter sp.]
MKIDFTEIGMIEIDSFYKKLVSDLSGKNNAIYTLDFADVESLSLPAIQIIISLKKHCDACNIELKCINIVSHKILQSIKIYNIEDVFGLAS